MSENEELYDLAVEAMNELATDLSVSQEEALENLQNLKGEIDVQINAIRETM